MSLLSFTDEHLESALAKFYKLRNEITDDNVEVIYNFTKRVIEINDSLPIVKRMHFKDEEQIDRAFISLTHRNNRVKQEREGK